MGEYALLGDDRVKIGTCEDMYYLRADQRHRVTAEPNSVDPCGEEAYELRFRFPWPSEDHRLPGDFEDYAKAVQVPRLPVPAGVEHYTVQFKADAGYLISLPCPEGPDNPLDIHRNGFRGAVLLKQQKLLRDGRLVPVCRCGGCGAAYRIEEPMEIHDIAEAFEAAADQHQQTDANAKFYREIARRIRRDAKLATPEPATA